MTSKIDFFLSCISHYLGHCVEFEHDAKLDRVSAGELPFRNTSLSWHDRVNDLINRLTIEELMVQMSRGGSGPHGGPAPAIPRLKIDPWSWNTECLRGDGDSGNATAFPQALGLAATWSTEVIHKVSEATSIEVRAKYNFFRENKQYGDHKGISCFSPVVNIMRHPLWGRNQETYGEDPLLSGTLAYSFVQGLQGGNPRYVRTNAGCKHLDVHGGPENIPVSRFSFDAKVTERDWRLTFLPAFKKCVEAGTYSFMCSFNRINGVPACGNKKLLTDILRKELGFTGYVVSDQAAIENIIDYHHYTNNSVDTVALCVNAGCNLELSTNLEKPIYFSMLDAIKAGKLSKETVLESAKPLFYTRMKLGEFDPLKMNPYNYLDMSLVQSEDHRQIALDAAKKSFVLLKNNGSFLPLTKRLKKIAVLGPMANNVIQQFGNYNPNVMPMYTTTPLDGLKQLSDVTNFAAGCKDNRCIHYSSSAVKSAVNNVDVIFICLGTGLELESEDNDRGSMELPVNQSQIVKDAVQFSGSTPIVLLLFNAGPLNITWMDEHPRIYSIMECFFPAQATGDAIKQVLTNSGNNSNPAGRLPFTWYKNRNQIPSMTDYSMTQRTYRYFTGKPLYPFGYGLSYSKFYYYNAWMNPSIKAGTKQGIRIEVGNSGPYAGDEIVQIYLKWTNITQEMPNIQLVSFKRVHLEPQQVLNFLLFISPESMAVWDDKDGFVIEPGKIQLFIGGQQPGQSKVISSNILTRQFTIVDRKVLNKYSEMPKDML
ncbi:uncharacterized protein LOC134686622 [Mytilus trossulus]|uniref:uncharacterized protein LOC134686622 n=1 Tax=Mytilus trossulus TaxID=6551 RepID=UPI0030044F13